MKVITVGIGEDVGSSQNWVLDRLYKKEKRRCYVPRVSHRKSVQNLPASGMARVENLCWCGCVCRYLCDNNTTYYSALCVDNWWMDGWMGVCVLGGVGGG